MNEFIYFQKGDPGDKKDELKWDFDESNLNKIRSVDGYTYFVNNKNNVDKLMEIRKKVNDICLYIHNNINSFNPKAINGLKLFIYIHGELQLQNYEIPDDLFKHHWIQEGGVSSKVMYGEIPKGTLFLGLNKPKSRHVNNKVPNIGKDKQLRSGWRHIFFKIPENGTIYTDKDFKELVIHELAHTAANHTRWRNDDHNEDFRMYENIIKDVWDII